MMSPSAEKRLDAAEVALTPKEWAIRMVDAFRKSPTRKGFYQDHAPSTDSPEDIGRASTALVDQAESRYPGKKPEDARARYKLANALQVEYRVLFRLAINVNEEVAKTAEVNGLKAALKLANLEKIVRQDAFGRTARKAAEWVQEYKAADADEEENRQIMLKELDAYTDVYLGETWADSLPLPGGGRLRFPSAVEEWIADVVATAAETLAHRAAVKTIQDKYFDGHPVLFQDTEANLDAAIKALEDGIATFNDYLKTRAELFKADWEVEEESEDGITSAIPGEREGKLTIDIARVRKMADLRGGRLAGEWVALAKFEGKVEELPQDAEHDDKMTALYVETYGPGKGS